MILNRDVGSFRSRGGLLKCCLPAVRGFDAITIYDHDSCDERLVLIAYSASVQPASFGSTEEHGSGRVRGILPGT